MTLPLLDVNELPDKIGKVFESNPDVISVQLLMLEISL